MKKRTIKKRVPNRNNRTIKKNKPVRRTNKKSKKSLKRSKKRTSKKIVQQGGGADITLILDILLSKDVITYLPTSQIFEYDKMKRYMNMVDIHTLKDIVLENSYWRKSPTIQRIFNYSSEELQDPKKIKFDEENVNCENLINDRNNNLKKLFLFLFECNKDIFVKENVDWYKVILGLEIFDETFEYQVMKSIIDMGLFMKKEEIIENIKLLENNLDFKLIIKKRLYNCAEKPRSFFERIFSSTNPSFPSFSACDKKGDSVLYLYDEYKRFLAKKSEDGLSKLDKVKILIFCETRQHLLSKYVGLEMIRLNDKKYSDIRQTLHTIFKLDKEIIKENDAKLKELTLEQDNERDIKKNLDNIDQGIEEGDSKELTEEEKMIQELEEQRIKSENEGENFLNEEERINQKVNATEETEQTGGAVNVEDTPKIVIPEINENVENVEEVNPQMEEQQMEEQDTEEPDEDMPDISDLIGDESETQTVTPELDTEELEDEIPINAEEGVTDDILESLLDSEETQEEDGSEEGEKKEEEGEDEGDGDGEEEQSKEDKIKNETVSFELYNKCKDRMEELEKDPRINSKDVNEGIIDDCEKKLGIGLFASTTSPNI